MNKAELAHPSPEQLAAFDLGQLPAAESAQIERHVAECHVCCGHLEAVADDALVALLRVSAGKPGAPPAGEPPETLAEEPVPSNTPPPFPAQARPEIPEELIGHPRYRVLELLGSGGMGAVFKAEHRLMERVIVLKVIHKHFTDRPAAVERFRLEVKAAARLSHPNIVTAHDADQAGDVHFLVMEFVDGTSLDRLVHDRGPLPIAEACAYVRQAALGLQHAFERGMVHRDLKPANLMLTPDGKIKILDFGLARFASESGPDTGLTEPGMIVGTPDYMAPEQALDPRQADIRSDVYSLGCTLYFLLTGQAPFPEGTPLQKLMAHQQQRPRSVSELRAAVPADLVSILDRMLARDPEDRYQTPAEVTRALSPLAIAASAAPTESFPAAPKPRTAGEAGARPKPWRTGFTRFARRQWRLLTAAGVLAAVVGLVVLAFSAFWTRHGQKEEESAEMFGPVAATRAMQPLIGGQTGPFTSVIFRADCREALAAGPDHAVQLWDLHTGQEVARLPGHTGPVRSLAFSPDGRRALSGGEDKTVRVWDLAERRLLATLEGHQGPVRSVLFAWDGRHAFSAGDDGKLVLWETNEPRLQDELRGDGYAVAGLAVEKLGGFAAVGCSDKRIRIWDLEHWKAAWSYAGHQDTVTSLTWSPDMRYLLSGSADRTVRLWRGTKERELCRFAGHTAAVRSVVLSADSRRALSGGEDRTVRLWDVAKIKELACFQGHEDAVLAVAFCPDGRRAISGSSDGTFRLWQLPPSQSPNQPRAQAAGSDDEPAEHTERVGAMAITPDGKLLVTANGDEDVRLWDVNAAQEQAKLTERAVLKGHVKTVLSVAITADGKTAASGSWDQTVKLWNTATGQERATLQGHTAAVRSVAFTADGKTLASGSPDRTVRLWDTKTAQQQRVLRGHTAAIRAVAFSADGRLLASAGEDRTIRLWDAGTGAERGTLEGHTGTVYALAFSGDGKTLASGSADGTATRWDLATRKEPEVLRWHEGAVYAVAITREAKMLATGSADHRIKLWPGGVLRGHRAGVSSLMFTANGKLLAAASLDGQVQLWEVTGGGGPDK